MQNPFGIRPTDRVALYIDGPNFYAATKALNFDIDYKKLRDHFRFNCDLVRIHYYTALRDDDEGREHQSIRPLVDWLSYNGYDVVTKPTKEFVDAAGRRKVKGNMDIDLAVDMLEDSAFVTHQFLFSGDGDFLPVVRAVQRRGVCVTAVSVLSTPEGIPMIADELRRQVNYFVDLSSVKGLIGRDPSERSQDDKAPSRRIGGGSFRENDGVRKTLGYGSAR